MDSVSSVSYKDFLPNSVVKQSEKRLKDFNLNQSFQKLCSHSAIPQRKDKQAITGRSFFSNSKSSILKPLEAAATDTLTQPTTLDIGKEQESV